MADRDHTLLLADLRENYTRGGLSEADCDPSPIVQFGRWFTEARQAKLPEPNAMTLATVDVAGQPSARIVLLKGVGEGGFVFYSNYDSRKGRDLRANAKGALVFYWAELERQVRIEGIIARIDRETSEMYFHSRPRGSQLGAWASAQSQPIASRVEVESKLNELEAHYGEAGEIPLPPFWGGYRLAPQSVEFWQGRPNRLHDRIRYQREKSRWRRERLSP